MNIDLSALLSDNPMLLLFTVIGLGYLAGNLRLADLQAGSVIGVLVVGLFFGHLGFVAPVGAGTFGFALFIFSVGIQAGPTFFSAFAADGVRYVVLALVVAATAAALAFGLSELIGFQDGFGAGMLAGALTSTPTLAGAQDSVNSGLATLSSGVTAEQARENIGVGYAITYVFGTVGTILAVRFFPRLAGIDLPAEAARFAEARGLNRRRGRGGSLPIVRAYRVGAEAAGKTIGQINAEHGQVQGKILQIKRDGSRMDASPDLMLQERDIVSLIASIDVHARARELSGEEVLDAEMLSYRVTRREIVVAEAKVVGKPLKDLDMPNTYGCFATGLTRASVDLPLDPALPLMKDDRLEVVGERDHLRRLAELIGFIEQDLEKTDLATFAFGMIAGILLGLVIVVLGDISIGLGTAGGLLLVGILIGYLGSVMPTFGRVPAPARFVLMEFGLMLFMASVGLNAGGGVVAALASVGPLVIASGVLITLLPALAGYLVGRYLLRMNPALLLGAITGAMTSTPALNVVTEAARSGVPSLGYAGTYTFANVLLTFAGALMMVF